MYNLPHNLVERFLHANMDIMTFQSLLLHLRDKWPQLNDRTTVRTVPRGVWSYHIPEPASLRPELFYDQTRWVGCALARYTGSHVYVKNKQGRSVKQRRIVNWQKDNQIAPPLKTREVQFEVLGWHDHWTMHHIRAGYDVLTDTLFIQD